VRKYAVRLCGGDFSTEGSYFAMAEFQLHVETHKCGRRGKPFCRKAKALRKHWRGS
jgi:hypothetical protein